MYNNTCEIRYTITIANMTVSNCFVGSYKTVII